MLKKLFFLAILPVIFSSQIFAQETFTNEAAKVSVTLPAGWMYEAKDGGIVAHPEEGGFAVFLQVLPGDDLSAALEEVDKSLSASYTNLVWGEGVKRDINGMSAVTVDGTADGIVLTVGVIDTPAPQKTLMVGAWGTPDVVEKYMNDISLILTSIAPAK